MKFSLEQQKQ